MGETIITYQRNGIVIKVTADQVVIKKNGLTIEVPMTIVEDFVNEFELEYSHLQKIIKEGFIET